MFNSTFDEKNKLWSTCDIPPVFNPHTSLANILLRSLDLFGSKTAQISDDSGVRLTFEEIHMMTIRAAQRLQKLGYKPKQIFGIMVENVANVSPIVFAAFSLGCPINTMHTSVEKANLIHMIRLIEHSVLFCDVKVYDLVNECLAELGSSAKIFTFNGTKGDSEAVETLFEETGFEDDFVPVQVDAVNDIAAIMSSSGTTGPFKGVCLSHASIVSHVGNLQLINSNDIFFCTSSLHWITGLASLLMGTLNGSTRIITTEPFSVEMQLRIIETYKVTVALGQSYHLLEILKSGLISKSDLTSLKHMAVGGSKIPVSVVEEFTSYMPNGSVGNAYGLTELASIAAIDFPKFSGKDTVGRLMNGFVVKIIDDDGNKCGIDTDGEICIKSTFNFLGYYKDKELTSEVIDNEGFMLTGDIGHIDKDGYVYIIGRKKDVIAYYFKIAPIEIESFLLKSSDIQTVCVVGVPYNSIIELPAAVVVRSSNSKITSEDICKMVEDNLVDYCKLRGGVYFVDSIPSTPSGKLLRRVAKEVASKSFNENRDNFVLEPGCV